MSIESQLRKILGEEYGGPALGYGRGVWTIYEWFDAPVSHNVLGSGTTIKEAIESYEKTMKVRQKLTRGKKKK